MNQTILFINKSDKGNLSTDKIIDIFKESDDLEEIKNAVERAEDRIYVTWASVDVVDRDGEKIPIKDLINDQDTLLKRNGPISDMHTNNIVGQTMAYKVMEHPDAKKIGILHLNRIFSDNEIDEKVWKETQSGERQGSSVGGFSKEDTFEKDKDSGRIIRIKDKFRQYETASVYKPSNPLALNEATSLVAKSYKDVPGTILFKSKVEKPAKLDRCVEALMADPDFKPQEGRTKEESAFAVCTAQIQKKHEVEKFFDNVNTYSNLENGDSVINNPVHKDNYDSIKSKKGDLTMDKEVKKQFSDMNDKIDGVVKSIKLLTKQDEDEEKKPPTAEDEEKTKKQETEDEKEKEKVEKEEAASDIDGEKETGKPDSPEPDDNNEESTFKNSPILKKIQKQMADMQKVVKSIRPTDAENGPIAHVAKLETEKNRTALDIALGKKKMTMTQVNKMQRDLDHAKVDAFNHKRL